MLSAAVWEVSRAFIFLFALTIQVILTGYQTTVRFNTDVLLARYERKAIFGLVNHDIAIFEETDSLAVSAFQISFS